MTTLHAHRGGPLERGLRRVINNVSIGSLLIQSEAKTGEPLLLHLQLPVCIRERNQAQQTYVFLLDAQVRSNSYSRLWSVMPYTKPQASLYK